MEEGNGRWWKVMGGGGREMEVEGDGAEVVGDGGRWRRGGGRWREMEEGNGR